MMKNIVIDTSSLIAVLLNEPEKNSLIEITGGCFLIAPASINWEIGTPCSAMFRKNRISLKDANRAVKIYKKIPLQIVDIDLEKALEISFKSKIYAYDAYTIVCAITHKSPLLTLDEILKKEARKYNIKIMEV